MKTTHKLTAVLTTIALGIGLGPATARAESPSEPAAESQSPEQARVADSTLKLEKAFNDQFVQGRIDRSALPIGAAVQAFPEAARPKVQAHIDQIVTDRREARRSVVS